MSEHSLPQRLLREFRLDRKQALIERAIELDRLHIAGRKIEIGCERSQFFSVRVISLLVSI